MLVITEFGPERKNGEKFGVCLNIYMQFYNWDYVFERTVPKIQVASLSCSFLNRLDSQKILIPIPSETQASRVCIWLLCPLLSFFIHTL